MNKRRFPMLLVKSLVKACYKCQVLALLFRLGQKNIIYMSLLLLLLDKLFLFTKHLTITTKSFLTDIWRTFKLLIGESLVNFVENEIIYLAITLWGIRIFVLYFCVSILNYLRRHLLLSFKVTHNNIRSCQWHLLGNTRRDDINCHLRAISWQCRWPALLLFLCTYCWTCRHKISFTFHSSVCLIVVIRSFIIEPWIRI